MNIWLITSGEIIPLENERSCRTGILSNRLALAGHQVTWWTTTFDHQTKSFIFNQNTENVSNGVKMIYLHSNIGYKKNISLQRLKNHKKVSYSFKNIAKSKEKPDLIFCSFPTIELSYEAVKYGVKNSVPVIIDVRDLWPDLFYNPFKKWMRPLIKISLIGYIKKTKYLFKHCNAITAISEGYLDWGLAWSKRIKKPEDRVFTLGYDKVVNSDVNYTDYFSGKGLDVSKIIVWFVGTFGQTYNLNTVIKVAQILETNKRNDIQFVFTGDGEKMAEWSQLAGALKNVVFTGWVNKDQLNYLSSIADIGLMAYRSDATQGLPNKLFEYMSAGIPIISSLQGETEELLNSSKSGLHYNADNAEMLLDQLLFLAYNADKRKEFGENGFRIFEKDYSSEVVYTKLVEYLEDQGKN